MCLEKFKCFFISFLSPNNLKLNTFNAQSDVNLSFEMRSNTSRCAATKHPSCWIRKNGAGSGQKLTAHHCHHGQEAARREVYVSYKHDNTLFPDFQYFKYKNSLNQSTNNTHEK